MSLTQAAAKLISTLEGLLGVLKQEKLVLPEEEARARQSECLALVAEIQQQMNTNDQQLLGAIEQILERAARYCAQTVTDVALANTPQTVLLKHQSKSFVLSKNIPRPQINFQSRDNQYPPTQELLTPEGGASGQISAAALPELHRLLCEMTCSTPPSATLVDSKEALARANSAIAQEAVVGVDIKTHTFRSYKGFICFLQVATPSELYVFDMLALRAQAKELSFLSSPKVAKIFYGLPQKRYWIDRDTPLSLAGGVDLAALAADAAHLNGAIRAHLGIVATKEFVLLDWRYREVTEEMYTQLKNDVKHLLPLAIALARKTPLDECQRRLGAPAKYTGRAASPEAFAAKYGLPVTRALMEVFSLREFIAKQEDESPSFVLTNRQMQLFLTASPGTPEEAFRTLPRVSSLFKANLNNFLRVLHAKPRANPFDMALLTSQ